MPPLAPFQLPLDGRPHEVRPVFGFLQDGLDPVESPLGEPSLHVLGPHLFSDHDDYFSYEVLTMDKSYEIFGSQSRETDMQPTSILAKQLKSLCYVRSGSGSTIGQKIIIVKQMTPENVEAAELLVRSIFTRVTRSSFGTFMAS
jgi:hypothetical protein